MSCSQIVLIVLGFAYGWIFPQGHWVRFFACLGIVLAEGLIIKSMKP